MKVQGWVKIREQRGEGEDVHRDLSSAGKTLAVESSLVSGSINECKCQTATLILERDLPLGYDILRKSGAAWGRGRRSPEYIYLRKKIV